MFVKLHVKFHPIWSPVVYVLAAVKKLQNKDRKSGAGIFTKSLRSDACGKVCGLVSSRV